MKKKTAKIYDVKRSISVDRSLFGIGLTLRVWSDKLKTLDPNDWYADWFEVVQTLEMLSDVIATIIDQHEELLHSIEVELPPDIGAVEVPNPYFQATKKGDVDTLDDIPF